MADKEDSEKIIYKEKVRGGKLKLKNAELSSSRDKKKSKKKSSKKRSRDEDGDASERRAKKHEPEETPAERAPGTGRIISSGDTVHGQDTKFLKDLQVGDAIEVFHPNSLKSETRVVRMVLSDVSLAINAPFSSDLISSTHFHCLRLPRKKRDPEEEKRMQRKEQNEEEERAFGTYASAGGKVLTYRVRKQSPYGGYKIVSKKVDDNLSREKLLEERCKHKSDRMCM